MAIGAKILNRIKDGFNREELVDISSVPSKVPPTGQTVRITQRRVLEQNAFSYGVEIIDIATNQTVIVNCGIDGYPVAKRLTAILKATNFTELPLRMEK